MKNILFIGISFLLLVSCQKKEIKTPPRCIYDLSVFAECSEGAAKNEELFATFKQNPFFNLLWENSSEEEGALWMEKIAACYPELLKKLERIKESDRIGSPRVYSYQEYGEFSPATLRFAALGGEIEERCGNLAELNVIQIGAGYGGLCKVLHATSGFKTYTLVDLPQQLALAKRYLDVFGVNNVSYLTPEELPLGVHYDLVLSDRSFSEFNRSFQVLFFDRILAHSHSGFLLGHLFPKHYGVQPLSFDELKSRFDKKGNFARWEIQEPTIESENYFIFWKQDT